MRSTFAIWTCSLVACGGKRDHGDLPPVVASMDYVSKSVRTDHTCVDIYDPARIAAWEKFCGIQHDKTDTCTFHRGEACPDGDQPTGCLERDGSITWLYRGQASCLFGHPFAGGLPTIGPVKPYHCKGPDICQEMESVFDLVPTAERENCKVAGGELSSAPCPSGAAGRCRMPGLDARILVRYPPHPVDALKLSCEVNHGEWLERAVR